MTGILLIIARPYSNEFNCNYLTNNFFDFFATYLKSTSIFEHFETNMTLIGSAFLKLETVKDVVN